MDSKALLSLNHLSVWYTADHPLLSDFFTGFRGSGRSVISVFHIPGISNVCGGVLWCPAARSVWPHKGISL